MSKQYRKVNDLMKEAARILVGHGWRADKFEQLFGLSRSSAFRLAKQAREEHSKAVVAEALERARRQQAQVERERAEQEALSFKNGWERPQGDASQTRQGFSLRPDGRRFLS